MPNSAILVLLVAVAACSGEVRSALKFRHGGLQTQRMGFLARQEASPSDLETQTPYPSAAELKPAVPFVEATADTEPELTYGVPDLTYGPPQFALRPAVVEQLPAEDAPEEFAPPADVEDFSSAEVTNESGISARLTGRRRLISSRLRFSTTQKQRPQRLQKKQRLAKTQQLSALNPSGFLETSQAFPHPVSVVSIAPPQRQQYFVVNRPIAYVTQF